MTLQEMLETPEAKKMYRELAKKYHPDSGGDIKIMQKINSAKQDGDASMKRLYAELFKETKEKKPRKENKKGYDDIKEKKQPFDIYKATKEIQNEINENAEKMGVNDRVALLIKKKRVQEIDILDLVINYYGGPSGIGVAYLFNIERFKTKQELKKAILKLVIENI